MIRTTILATACALLLTATVAAQPGPTPRPDRGPEMPGPERERLIEKLHLTEQQEEQIQKLRLEFAKAETQTAAKIKTARLDLVGFFAAESPDRAAIEKTLKTISDLQHQQKLQLVDHLFAVRTILTPEQQKAWRKHMRSRIASMGEGGWGRPRGREFRREIIEERSPGEPR